MPNVNGRKFSYTPAGRQAARRYANRTGQQMSSSRNRGQRGMAQRSSTANRNAQGPRNRRR